MLASSSEQANVIQQQYANAMSSANNNKEEYAIISDFARKQEEINKEIKQRAIAN